MNMPRDAYHLVWIILWVLGAGVLFPWNAFISAPDYFTKFPQFIDPGCELTGSEKRIWDNIPTYFTVSYSAMNVLGQAIVVSFGGKVTISNRVIYSILTMFITMIGVPAISYTSISRWGAFAFLVTCAGACGLSSAFFQATSFGLGALFPSSFTQAVMIGNGSAGLAVSLLRVATKAAGGSERFSGAIYFYLATAWLCISIGCFIVMRKLKFAQKHVDEFRTFKRYSLVVEESDEESTATYSVDEEELASASWGEIMAVFKNIYPMAFLVWLTLFITISVFPGVVAKIPSNLSDGWFTVWLIFIYNAGDNIGRVGPKFLVISKKLLMIVGVVRAGFIPLIIMCVDPYYITSEAMAAVLVGLMSMTNGYTASLSMMYGPQIPNSSALERQIAGTIMSFMLLLGITCGSFAGLLISNYLPSDDSSSGSGSASPIAW
eukprot:TRINITY_DN903_c1_g2_i1.p1 TRINITY_DN903_c1_g2~~TRINITY_DN903_c1_g2_i1.p1  ORF type:complete len:434 (+),score=50.23 TRINITY_DN903_c1_g2_i1:43-1344(+)